MPAPKLYQQFFIDKRDERVDLFRTVARRYDVKTALYPGSFVQIGPSFVIPNVIYVDNDRRAGRFFADPLLREYVKTRREYDEDPQLTFHHCSYESEFDELPASVDLLISQYAGFISPVCKTYLKVGGVLLVNDSHGDASMAHRDPDFELVGVGNWDGDKFSLQETEQGDFFIPKRKVAVTDNELRERGRGIPYTRSADSYIFRKTA